MQSQKLGHEAGMETLEWGGGYGAGVNQFNEAQPPGFIEGFLKSLGPGKNENALYAQPDLYQGGAPVPLAQQLPNITKPKEILGTRTGSNLTINEQQADIAARAKPRELKAFEEMGFKPDLTTGQKEKLYGWATGNYFDRYNQKNEIDFEGKEYIQTILGQDNAFATKYMKIDPLDPNGRWILDMNKIGKDKEGFIKEADAIVNNASNVSTGVKRGLAALGSTTEEWAANTDRIIRGLAEGETVPVAAGGKGGDIDANREKVYGEITSSIANINDRAKSEKNLNTRGLLVYQAGLLNKLKDLVNTHPDQMRTLIGQNSVAGLTDLILANPKDNERMRNAFKTIFGIELSGGYSDLYPESSFLDLFPIFGKNKESDKIKESNKKLKEILPWYYKGTE
jgi:hypothetical protein